MLMYTFANISLFQYYTHLLGIVIMPFRQLQLLLFHVDITNDFETFDALPSSWMFFSYHSMCNSFLIHAQIQLTLHSTDTHYARPQSKHSQEALKTNRGKLIKKK